MNNWNEFFFTTLYPWLTTSGLKIVFILLVAFVIRKFAHVFVEKGVRRMIDADRLSPQAEIKRENTLIRIINGTLSLVVLLVALMMILQEVGVAIGPLLAAAGVAGLALGFGGQYLIRDIISGLFIILENQYRVGDVACFDGTCGLVEDISLRMTTLRDLDGTVYHIPHGEIKKVSNLTKYYSRVNLNIRVAYETDLEKLITVINQVGEELAQDPLWKEKILKPPRFERVDDFAESAMVVKILGDTQPIEQWAVTGELRKRLKVAFDKEGIVIPLPQRVVHQARATSVDEKR